MANPNSLFTELTVSTLKARKSEIVDNMSQHNALWRRIKENKGIRTVNGGTTIVENLDYTENQTFMRYSGYDLLNISPSTEAELQAQPFLRKMVQEEPASLNVASLRDWRGGIGERMKAQGAATTNDATQAELRALYGNASKDIEAALPPEILQSLHDYNQWYSQGKNTMRDVEKAFFGNKDATSTAKSILSADAAQLAQLRNIVGEDVFRQIQAGAIREMSRGAKGFSPAVASTKLSSGKTALQPKVQEALFGGEADQLRGLSDALQGSRTFTNTSNTAGASHVLQALGLGAGGIISLPAAAAAAAMPYGAARAVTSPRLINKLGNIQQRPSLFPTVGNVGTQAILRSLMGQ